MEGWFTIKLDDDTRISPAYASLGERASTELLVVFACASLLVGTAAWWIVFRLLWGWLAWLVVCVGAAALMRTRMTLFIPGPLLRYLRSKAHHS